MVHEDRLKEAVEVSEEGTQVLEETEFKEDHLVPHPVLGVGAAVLGLHLDVDPLLGVVLHQDVDPHQGDVHQGDHQDVLGHLPHVGGRHKGLRVHDVHLLDVVEGTPAPVLHRPLLVKNYGFFLNFEYPNCK